MFAAELHLHFVPLYIAVLYTYPRRTLFHCCHDSLNWRTVNVRLQLEHSIVSDCSVRCCSVVEHFASKWVPEFTAVKRTTRAQFSLKTTSHPILLSGMTVLETNEKKMHCAKRAGFRFSKDPINYRARWVPVRKHFGCFCIFVYLTHESRDTLKSFSIVY